MKKTLSIFGLSLLLAGTVGLWQSCSKSSSTTSSTTSSVLTIQTGAQSIAPGATIPFSAVLVGTDGKTTTPSSVTWSVTSAGSGSIGSFSGNTFTGSGIGYGTVTASTTVDGKTLTASIPVGIYSPTVFGVVPSAVIWTTGAGTIPLSPVYIGTGSTSYTYSSSDATVASVDASGVISFLKAGQCLITVTATGLSGSPTVCVPVLVVGLPTATLPVARVVVTPSSSQLFRGGTTTLAAAAYDMSGTSVSSPTFTWASQDPSIATIDQTGKVTAVKLGKTIVTATASGIMGQSEIDVLPDTAIIVTPMWASISAGGTKQLTAKAYKVNSDKSITEITGFTGITWQTPSYGVPMVDSMFNIATVDGTGLVTMKSTATIGMASFVIASASSPTIEPGVA